MIKLFNKFKMLILRLFDIGIIAMVFTYSSIIFFGSILEMDYNDIYYLLFVISVYCIVFEIFGAYKPIWKYAGTREICYLFFSCMIASFINVIGMIVVDRSIPLIFFAIHVNLFAGMMIVFSRIIYRTLNEKFKHHNSANHERVVIVGGGLAGSMLLKNMGEKELDRYTVLGIFDDDKSKHGKEINGIKVIGDMTSIPEFCHKNKVDIIIIAITTATPPQMERILDRCMLTSCLVRTLPTIDQLSHIDKPTNASISTLITSWSNIKNIKIEDFLGRASIDLHSPQVNELIEGKVILVTGGGGSIGSELCRQIAMNKPAHLIILDNYENNAYDIQQELTRKHNGMLNFTVEICSVREYNKVEFIINKYRPHIVYHAAAHKHVPLMEHNPEEAVKNNIFGTYNVAKASLAHNVQKFILISSDKAVNPTNIMGATKRVCEMIIQSMNNHNKTQFVAVRFGNVLGSNGSIVPLFKRQIDEGGPVTVTHPDMIRYFMTINEAVSLVLTASTSNELGEVFVLDMGAPVNIYQFAIKMIRMSGLIPEKDIKIEFTGLRPGEKLYEELLVNESNKKTEYDKIFIEPISPVAVETIEQAIVKLKEIVKHNSKAELVSTILELVPTYKASKEIKIDTHLKVD